MCDFGKPVRTDMVCDSIYVRFDPFTVDILIRCTYLIEICRVVGVFDIVGGVFVFCFRSQCAVNIIILYYGAVSCGGSVTFIYGAIGLDGVTI